MHVTARTRIRHTATSTRIRIRCRLAFCSQFVSSTTVTAGQVKARMSGEVSSIRKGDVSIIAHVALGFVRGTTRIWVGSSHVNVDM